MSVYVTAKEKRKITAVLIKHSASSFENCTNSDWTNISWCVQADVYSPPGAQNKAPTPRTCWQPGGLWSQGQTLAEPYTVQPVPLGGRRGGVHSCQKELIWVKSWLATTGCKSEGTNDIFSCTSSFCECKLHTKSSVSTFGKLDPREKELISFFWK